MSPLVADTLESPTAKGAESTSSRPDSLTADMRRRVPNIKQGTQEDNQEDKNQEDAIEARIQAERNLEKLWMDRLQLISVITTFFASTETQLLSNTIPSQSGPSNSAEQAANAALTGALVLHSFAATLSFTIAFVLVRFRLQETKEKRGDTDIEKQKVWSINSHAHVAMHRVGFRQQEPPLRLLHRFSLLCTHMSVVGFCLAATGILCLVWAKQTKSVSIFASVCLAGCSVAGLVALFVPSQEPC